MPVDSVDIYTDGCCLRNPGGAGGCAARVVRYGRVIKETSKGFTATTNNRMEIMAAIAGIECLSTGTVYSGTVYSDSQYLVHAIENGWLRKWKRNGWRTRDGKPVKNQDLWEWLDRAMNLHSLRFVWVRGHDGNEMNERCDSLAGMVAKLNAVHEDAGYVLDTEEEREWTESLSQRR